MEIVAITKVASFNREDFSTEFTKFLKSVSHEWKDTLGQDEHIYHIGDVLDAVIEVVPSKHVTETYNKHTLPRNHVHD